MLKLPHIPGAQAIKALERLGFVVVRQSGSHIIMRKVPAVALFPTTRK